MNLICNIPPDGGGGQEFGSFVVIAHEFLYFYEDNCVLAGNSIDPNFLKLGYLLKLYSMYKFVSLTAACFYFYVSTFSMTCKTN